MKKKTLSSLMIVKSILSMKRISAIVVVVVYY